MFGESLFMMLGHCDHRGEDAGAPQHQDRAPGPWAQVGEIQDGEEGEGPGQAGGDGNSQMQVPVPVSPEYKMIIDYPPIILWNLVATCLLSLPHFSQPEQFIREEIREGNFDTDNTGLNHLRNRANISWSLEPLGREGEVEAIQDVSRKVTEIRHGMLTLIPWNLDSG